MNTNQKGLIHSDEVRIFAPDGTWEATHLQKPQPAKLEIPHPEGFAPHYYAV